jgi:hypothetical protein
LRSTAEANQERNGLIIAECKVSIASVLASVVVVVVAAGMVDQPVVN